MLKDKILENPAMYRLSQMFFGGSRGKMKLKKYLKHDKGANVLDIGCGTADIVKDVFFDANYTGFDMQKEYILKNKKEFKEYDNINFYCENINDSKILENLSKNKYDLITMLGVMHHLNDEELGKCLKSVSVLLEKGGRFVSFDGLRYKGQPFIERKLMDYDRGNYVRYEDEYVNIVRKYIPRARYDIRHDINRFPYTHIIFY